MEYVVGNGAFGRLRVRGNARLGMVGYILLRLWGAQTRVSVLLGGGYRGWGFMYLGDWAFDQGS